MSSRDMASTDKVAYPVRGGVAPLAPPSTEPLTETSRLALGDGAAMPLAGFGCYQIPPADVARCVQVAVRAGYAHVDTAEAYRNEAGVGAALRGVEPRPFVTTKIWPGNPAWGQRPKSYDATFAAASASAAMLGAPPDLLLNHGPFGGGEADRVDQWRALLDAKRAGLAASVGVSNYGVAHLLELERAGLERPACNQLELHPRHQQRDLLEFMAERRIAPIAYSSLAPLGQWRAGQQSSKADRDEDEVLAHVARKADRTAAQVLLRWGLQKGYAILPKSTTPARVAENAALWDFALDVADVELLDGMAPSGPLAFGQPDKPYDPTTAP